MISYFRSQSEDARRLRQPPCAAARCAVLQWRCASEGVLDPFINSTFALDQLLRHVIELRGASVSARARTARQGQRCARRSLNGSHLQVEPAWAKVFVRSAMPLEYRRSSACARGYRNGCRVAAVCCCVYASAVSGLVYPLCCRPVMSSRVLCII